MRFKGQIVCTVPVLKISLKGEDSVVGNPYDVFRVFPRFRLVQFVKKFKTGVQNLKIEKVIAFDKHVPELFFVFYFHNN